jgi:hypothetical protein
MWYGIVALAASSCGFVCGFVVGGLISGGKVQAAELRRAAHVNALRQFFAKHRLSSYNDGWIRVRAQDLSDLLKLTED